MRFFFIALLGLILLSCASDPVEVEYHEQKIREILDDIKSAFNMGDLETIMSFYHEDFLHNSMETPQVEDLWTLRLMDYILMDITDIDIEVDNYDAVASFVFYLDEDKFIAPDEQGEFSYFYREDGEWSIYGNQQW
jgi:hypothetical protein